MLLKPVISASSQESRYQRDVPRTAGTVGASSRQNSITGARALPSHTGRKKVARFVQERTGENITAYRHLSTSRYYVFASPTPDSAQPDAIEACIPLPQLGGEVFHSTRAAEPASLPLDGVNDGSCSLCFGVSPQRWPARLQSTMAGSATSRRNAMIIRAVALMAQLTARHAAAQTIA